MDPEIQRMIEDVQSELRELIQVMRNLGNTISAIGDQELKVDEYNRELKKSKEQVKEFTGLLDASGRVIQSESQAREEATGAIQDETAERRALTAEERRSRQEQFVYRRSQRSAFRDLAQELSTTRGLTGRLQETVLSSKAAQGQFAQALILLAEGALRGLGKAVVSLTRDIYAGQRGAAVSAKALGELGDSVGTAMQGVGGALALFALIGTFNPAFRLFGVAIGAARGALAALAAGLAALGIGAKVSAEALKVMAEQNDKLVRAYNDLSRGAVGVEGGLDGLRKNLQLAGVSVAELEGFAQQLASGAQTLAFLGVTTGQAAQQFAAVAGDVRKSGLGRELELLGIQSEEQRETILNYMSLQARLGRSQSQTTRELAQGSAKYAKELDLLAQLTGTTRKEQQQIRERQMADERFRSAIAAAKARDDQAEIARLERAGKLAAAIEAAGDKAGATGILQIAAAGGALTTPEAVAAEMTYGVTQVLNSQASVTEALQQMVENGRISQAQFADINRLIGTIDGVQVNVVDLANVIARVGPALEKSRRTGEDLDTILKREQALRQQADKDLQNNVDAARTQQNAALLMDEVVSSYNYSATIHKAASATFAAAVEKFANTVGAGPIAGGLLDARQIQAQSGQASENRAFAAGRGQVQGTSEDYLARVAQLESGGRNIANQPRPGQTATSAFGVYQITKDTFKGLVANAPPGSPLRGKTFEDMKTDVNLQTEAMKQLTSSNEQLLARRGLSTSDAAKYMAHMMGYPTAARILEAPAGSPIQRLVPMDWLEKNNLQHLKTAGDLRRHFDEITGGKGYREGGIARGPESGYLALLHGTEAVIPMADGKHIPVDQGRQMDQSLVEAMAHIRSILQEAPQSQQIVEAMQRIDSGMAEFKRVSEITGGNFAFMQERLLPDLMRDLRGEQVDKAFYRNMQTAIRGTDVNFMPRADLPTAAATNNETTKRVIESTARQQTDLLSAQLTRLDEMTTVMRNQLDTNRRILQVSQN